MKKHMVHMLILGRDDPRKEMEFELDFQLSMTASQRYEIMDRLVKDGLELIRPHGYKNTPAVTTRS